MATISRCPLDDELWSYLHDRLSETDETAVTEHIQTCSKCESTLSDLIVPGRPATAAAPPAPTTLVARLQRLWKAGPRPLPSDRPEDWPALRGFEILAVLGRGGSGVVYRARQLELGREVAVKMLRPGPWVEAAVKRLLHDASTASRLQHPHIVPVYEVGEYRGVPYFVLELVSGGSLAQRLRETVEAAQETARLVAQLARAVDFAHQHGVCHRDVKPANVMLRVRRPGECGRPAWSDSLQFPLADMDACLTDFGLAKRIHEEGAGLTMDGAAVGTPGYMAPEQVRSERPLPTSDVYGLGAVLFECLTGQPPFRGATPFDTLLLTLHAEVSRPRILNRRLARDLENICLKALEKEPSRRYTTAAGLADDLERWLRGEPVRARQIGRIGRGWRWCRRNPALAALALSILSGLVASLCLWRQAANNEARALSNEMQAQASLASELAAHRAAAEQFEMLRTVMHDNIFTINSPASVNQEKDPQRLEVLLQAETALARLLAQQPSDVQLQIMHARILTLLGTAQFLQHQDLACVATYERAIAVWRQVAHEEAGRLEHRVWHSMAYICLEQAYDRQNRRPEASQCFGAAVRIWRTLIEEDPIQLSQDNLFPAAVNLRWLLMPNILVEPDPSDRYEVIREHLERTDGPEDHAFFYTLLRFAYLSPKGELYLQTKHFAGLLTVAREAEALLSRSLAEAALPRGQRIYIAYHALRVCAWLRRTGHENDALPLALSSNHTLRELLQRSPDDPLVLRFLSESWHEIGKIHWDLDHVDETLAACREAVAAQRRLVELTPAVEKARATLGSRYMQLGRKLCEADRLNEAEACFVHRQALWPGDAAKHTEALREIRKWADNTGMDAMRLSPTRTRERQRYLDLFARLERRGFEPTLP